MSPSDTRQGCNEGIKLIAFAHGVKVLPDVSGHPAEGGKRQHEPITITKEVDKSSPLLYFALTHSENLPSVKIQVWRPTRTGSAAPCFTIELLNASVSRIKSVMPNAKIPENMALRYYEEVSFTYQKITWHWEENGDEAEDDWESPAA